MTYKAHPDQLARRQRLTRQILSARDRVVKLSQELKSLTWETQFSEHNLDNACQALRIAALGLEALKAEEDG